MEFFTIEKTILLISESILAKYPNLLVIDKEGWTLVIPSHVIEATRRSLDVSSFDRLNKAIEAGKLRKTIVTIDSDESFNAFSPEYFGWVFPRYHKIYAVSSIIHQMQEYKDVKNFYVTYLDYFDEQFWNTTRFQMFEEKKLTSLISENGKTRSKATRFFQSQKTLTIGKFIIILFCFSALVFVAYNLRDEIFVYRNRLLLVISAVAGSIGLYVAKTTKNIWYGAAEFLVGLLTFYIAVESLENSSPGIKFYLSTLAGLYIMVRGLDNMNKYKFLDKNWKEARLWIKRLFS